jgi:hypothetical protein
MATPFPFGSGNVLTAAQMNAITTLPVSTKTGSYTLTVADVGYRIVMNSASATTITVNTSIFGASDKVEILNIGAGVCTVTAGTCTVGSSGTLALVQNAGGTLTFISTSASVFTASGVSVSAGGLVFLSSATFSAAATVSLPASTFTSTYANYRIVFVATAFSAEDSLTLRMRASGTDSTAASYEYALIGYTTGGTLNGIQSSGQTSAVIGYALTTGVGLSMDIYNPQATAHTRFTTTSYGKSAATGVASPLSGGGSFAATTSFDALSFISGSNMTGRYAVYGYNIS